jgi:hypothetical protein
VDGLSGAIPAQHGRFLAALPSPVRSRHLASDPRRKYRFVYARTSVLLLKKAVS